MDRQPVRTGPRHAAHRRRRAAPRTTACSAPGTGRRPQAPVFVDVTGRRRRVVRYAVLAAGLLLAAYLSVVGVGLLVGAEAPMTPWPVPGSAEPGESGAGGTEVPSPEAAPTNTAGQPTRPGAAGSTATPSTASAAPTTAQPTPSISRPGNSRATPRGNGRTKSPNARKL